MKKSYTSPVMEVEEITSADIITSSEFGADTGDFDVIIIEEDDD